MRFHCSLCGSSCEAAAQVWRCHCGAPFVLEYPARLDVEAARRGARGVWRWAGALPPIAEAHRVTLGEGDTPLVAAEWAGVPVHFKLEYASPTASFKDRGVAVLASWVKSQGVARVTEDSSGNAGASLAAYCARAGIPCDLYAPEGASAGKLLQARASGARVITVPGPREGVAKAAQDAAAAAGCYASHNWSPFFPEGVKTWAFEAWEQLGGRVPDAVVVPCGFGSLVLGAWMGFRALADAGAADRMPRIVAVQAANCAPVAAAFRDRLDGVPGVTSKGTMAEGIACPRPVRGPQVMRALWESKGEAVEVSEEEIAAACRDLGRLGFFVEPSGAVGAAGLRCLAERGAWPAGQTVVVVLSGSGLKTPDRIAAVLADSEATT
jgi:threonine synthase